MVNGMVGHSLWYLFNGLFSPDKFWDPRVTGIDVKVFADSKLNLSQGIKKKILSRR